VVVVSDGAVNAGADPVAAARALGLPVNVVPVGEGAALDRVITSIEAPSEGRVGQSEPVRIHLTSSEPRGQAIAVRLLEDGREIARATAIAPGAGPRRWSRSPRVRAPAGSRSGPRAWTRWRVS